MPARDIVVIGASAGGFEAIQNLVARFPPDLRAAVFVTVHVHPRSPGILPSLLNRIGPLRAVAAEDGMPVAMSTIYIAPPDYHLVVQNGFVQLSHGPKENLHRPCINVMFRSAATAYGERVAGVLLTGLLDDGAAGLWEIQRHNGATLVQDPEEATFRSMPDSAIRAVNVQYIVPLAEMAPLVARLASTDQQSQQPKLADPHIEPASQVCPECGGVMTKATMGNLLEYRCHTGHRLGLKSMIVQKTNVIEQALGTALAQSEELSTLLRSAVSNAPSGELPELEEEIQRRATEQEGLRRMLENARDISPVL